MPSLEEHAARFRAMPMAELREAEAAGATGDAALDAALGAELRRRAHQGAVQAAMVRDFEQGGPAAQAAHPTAVRIVDFDMPFGRMIVFMVKWAIASIPAMAILVVLSVALSVFLLALLNALLVGPGSR